MKASTSKGFHKMRQLTASQKIAVLEHRIARLEKQAMLSTIKKSLKDFFKWAKSRLQISIIGADDKEIKRQTKILLRDRKFLHELGHAPVRGGFSKLWNYAKIYLKRLGMLGGDEGTRDLRLFLVVIIILLLPKLGIVNVGYLLMTAPVLGLIGKALNMIASPFLGEYGEEWRQETQEDYARDIAREKLLNKAPYVMR
jgi:hypothetical protein